MTADIEDAIFNILKIPVLPQILKSCKITGIFPNSNAISFDSLNINNIITINKNNGRKEIDISIFETLADIVSTIIGQSTGNGAYDWNSDLKNCVSINNDIYSLQNEIEKVAKYDAAWRSQ